MGSLARAVLGLRNPKRTPQAKQTQQRAREIQAVNDLKYFQDFLKMLEKVAQEPVNVANHGAMIEQVGKQNAYREILAVLKQDLETAERMIGENQARQHLRAER